jgi:hypothetical protein
MHMKIGIDLHGVITRYPDLFLDLARAHLSWGNEIHIITGAPSEKALPELHAHGFTEKCYSHFFSIVDYHKRIGTPMWTNDKGTWEMDRETWWASKALYWKQEGINIHYDDSAGYNRYENSVTFILVK